MGLSNVKKGAILSYLLIFLNTVYGLVVTPFILDMVGESQYGVYKTIASLSSSLMVLDLGFGVTVLRYVSKFVAEEDFVRRDRYLGMSLFQTIILAALVLLVGGVVYFSLDSIYGHGFTIAEMQLARQMYLVLLANVGINFFENVFYGIVAGHNHFAFANGMKVLLLLGKTIAIWVILPLVQNVLFVVLTQLILSALVMLIHIIYIRLKLHVHYTFGNWEKQLFFESFRYTILLFAQSIVIQFNGNVDNMVIGATLGSQMVTVYSFAIMLFNMYEQFATSVSSLMLPTVTNLLHRGGGSREMEDLVVRVGQIQFVVLGAALCGFSILGKDFFQIWLGDGFEDCYYLVLILITPATIHLIQNVCLSILRAKNLMGFRTISLLYSTVLNCILTVFGTMYFGYYAAAIGTALSMLIGSVISMNIYYHIKLGLRIFRMLWRTVYKVLPALAAAVLVTLLLKNPLYTLLATEPVASFLVTALVFLVVYGVVLLPFMRKEIHALLARRG